MNTVHVIAAMLVALSVPVSFAGESVAPLLVEEIVDGKAVMSPLIEEAAAGEQATTEPSEEDDTHPMRELCAGYADDEGVEGEDREAHIEECIKSMTDLSDSMQEKSEAAVLNSDAETLSEAGSEMKNTADTSDVNDTSPETQGAESSPATPEQQKAADPEALIANELVDKPAPGAEELIPKPTAKTK